MGHKPPPAQPIKPKQDALTGPAFARALDHARDSVIIPRISVAQPDGSLLIRPGKPIFAEDTITAPSAARLLGLSVRTIQLLCDIGQFRTAHKPGGRPKSRWRIALSEVLARRQIQP